MILKNYKESDFAFEMDYKYPNFVCPTRRRGKYAQRKGNRNMFKYRLKWMRQGIFMSKLSSYPWKMASS